MQVSSEKGVRQLLKISASLKQRKYREKYNLILLEGWRLVNDALLAKVKPVNIFISDKTMLERLETFPVDTVKKDQAVLIDTHSMKRLSCNVTPPGIVGVFKRPIQGEARKLLCQFDSYKPLPLTVICDGLKDPSNLGTLIRVCAASGCTSLMTTKGSIDVWDPKVLRCAAGGHFRLPIFYSLFWEEIVKQLKCHSRIFIADSNPTVGGKAHYEVDWSLGHNVLVVGGETTSLSEQARLLVKERQAESIQIPMVHGVDSLSAAISATIIIYEAYRQQFGS